MTTLPRHRITIEKVSNNNKVCYGLNLLSNPDGGKGTYLHLQVIGRYESELMAHVAAMGMKDFFGEYCDYPQARVLDEDQRLLITLHWYLQCKGVPTALLEAQKIARQVAVKAQKLALASRL